MRESIERTPLRTRLLNGHETNARLGSISPTSMAGSWARTYFAAVAPPQPPPITTARRPDFGMKSPFMDGAHPRSPPARSAAPDPATPRNALRVNRVMAGLLERPRSSRELPL